MRMKIGVMTMVVGILVAGCGGDEDETAPAVTNTAAGNDESAEGEDEEGQGPASTETENAEEEAQKNEGAALAEACTSDDDCASPSGFPTCITTTLIRTLGLSDTAEVPDGYCSDMTCEASTDCGEGAVQCIDLGASEVTDLFNICLKGCESGDACGEGQQCYCDEDGGILNAEGEFDFCTCMPEAIIDLLT